MTPVLVALTAGRGAAGATCRSHRPLGRGQPRPQRAHSLAALTRPYQTPTGLPEVFVGATVTRIVKGKLISTKAGRSLGRDPIEDLVRLTGALDELGLVTARTFGGHYVWTSLAPYFDDLFVPLTVMLLEAERGTPYADIVEWAFEDFEQDVDVDNPLWTEKFRRDFVESEMRIAITTLEVAGIATWDAEIEDIGHGISKRVGGTVTLTPGGRWSLYRYLAENRGLPLHKARPVEHTHLGFAELVRACEATDPDDFANVMREITAWLDLRGDDAITELTETARTTDDVAIRNMALAVLGERFAAAAEPAIRSLVDTPAARASALTFLVELDLETADVLIDPDVAVFIDVLALVLANRGPAAMVDVFQHVGPDDAQLAKLQQLWRQPSPAIGTVLNALGRHHPNARVAKGARKAAMQHATHQANQRRSTSFN